MGTQRLVLYVPQQFVPLMERERERMGCVTNAECLARILREWFSQHEMETSSAEVLPPTPSAPPVKSYLETLKEGF